MQVKHRKHSRITTVGKKIVYITPYRNAAIEMMKEYQRKGETVEVEKERDNEGNTMYVVYILARGI
jgi:hypothetical protein